VYYNYAIPNFDMAGSIDNMRIYIKKKYL